MKKRSQLFPNVFVGQKYSVDEFFWMDKSKYEKIPIYRNGVLLEWYPPELFLTVEEWRNRQIDKVI